MVPGVFSVSGIYIGRRTYFFGATCGLIRLASGVAFFVGLPFAKTIRTNLSLERRDALV